MVLVGAVALACGGRDRRDVVTPLVIPPLGDAGSGIRVVDGGAPGTRITIRPVGPRRPGDRVEVEWRGQWWAAVLLAPRGSDWLVHYEGYEDSWDEVVSEDRIRDVGDPE